MGNRMKRIGAAGMLAVAVAGVPGAVAAQGDLVVDTLCVTFASEGAPEIVGKSEWVPLTFDDGLVEDTIDILWLEDCNHLQDEDPDFETRVTDVLDTGDAGDDGSADDYVSLAAFLGHVSDRYDAGSVISNSLPDDASGRQIDRAMRHLRKWAVNELKWLEANPPALCYAVKFELWHEYIRLVDKGARQAENGKMNRAFATLDEATANLKAYAATDDDC